MFAVVGLESGKTVMSFKCTPEKFGELIEKKGINPAPYVGRYKWVALETFDALDKSELHELLKKSYTLVFEKLPKTMRGSIGQFYNSPTTNKWNRNQSNSQPMAFDKPPE